VRAKISYFGHLRSKAGIKSEETEFASEISVGDLLERSCKRRGIEREVFGQVDGTAGSVNILLNGRNIRFLEGLRTPVGDGDEISLFPPTGGG
jgi:molybdopterin synthase sulfur carrier subunit